MVIFGVRILTITTQFIIWLFPFFLWLFQSPPQQDFEHIGELTTEKSDGEIIDILESLTGYGLISKRKSKNN